jgi:hypothetical protein
MCFHRRLVFTCSHHAWGGLTQPCVVEKAFDSSERDEGCGVRWSHGIDTVRIQTKCPACVRTQADDKYRFGVVKEQIKVLKEHLELIRGVDGDGEKEKDVEKEEDVKGEEDASLSSSSAASGSSSSDSVGGGSEDTGDTSLAEGGCEGWDETIEEVRVDPNHRPLKLPQIVAERMAKGC